MSTKNNCKYYDGHMPMANSYVLLIFYNCIVMNITSKLFDLETKMLSPYIEKIKCKISINIK